MVHNKSIIITGPQGSGKTFLSKTIAEAIAKSSKSSYNTYTIEQASIIILDVSKFHEHIVHIFEIEIEEKEAFIKNLEMIFEGKHEENRRFTDTIQLIFVCNSINEELRNDDKFIHIQCKN